MRILELGKQYIQSRLSLAPDTTHPDRYKETLSRLRIDEGIRHVRDDKSVRLKDILKFIRLAKTDDDMVDIRGI